MAKTEKRAGVEKSVINVVGNFVEKVDEKTLVVNSNELIFIAEQIAKYGAEKHSAFLTRVFHGKKVSQEQFVKTIKSLSEKIANKKAKTNEVKTATKSKTTTKAKSKKEPKTRNEKTAEPKQIKVKPTKSSLEDFTRLEGQIAKLVNEFKEQWGKDIEISVVASYVYKVSKSKTIC